jgi:aryl-alcohol dehydrogenase-like predicted oxidoreductase
MQYRQLGAGGPQVPVLGLGAWPLGGGMGPVSEDTGIATIHAAIDQGITLIDTAQYYRTSEATIGRALRGGYRQRCFLATKVSRDFTPSGIRSAMEDSLRALEVDYVDLYQIHSWPGDERLIPAMETLERLRQEGKARYIGVSNFGAAQMQQALDAVPYLSNQPRYNLFDREIEAQDIPFCADHGIGILAHSPLAKGLLTGKYRPDHQFPSDDERSGFPRFQGEAFRRSLEVAGQLQAIARDKGLSLVQLAVAWPLRLPAVTCVLVGAKNPDQVREPLAAAEVTFTPDELERIRQIVADVPPRR